MKRCFLRQHDKAVIENPVILSVRRSETAEGSVDERKRYFDKLNMTKAVIPGKETLFKSMLSSRETEGSHNERCFLRQHDSKWKVYFPDIFD